MGAKTLGSLRPGHSARVVRVRGEGALQLRIMEMGLTRGVEVQVLKTAPLGDPLEIAVRGYVLSLRRADAALVEVTQAPAARNYYV